MEYKKYVDLRTEFYALPDSYPDALKERNLMSQSRFIRR